MLLTDMPRKADEAYFQNPDDERRVFYVGMTRAQQHLYLTSSRYRRTFGPDEPTLREVSRFLREIPSELIDGLSERDLFRPEPQERTTYSGGSYNSVDAVQRFLKKKGKTGAASPWSGRVPGGRGGRWILGTRVKHPKYGIGTVLRTEGSGDDAKLTVSFNNYGMKKLVARYASLEVV